MGCSPSPHRCGPGGAELSTIQWILLLNLAVILIHQLEEYRYPGGEPWILNEVFQPQGGPVDRYPLNQLNATFINVLAWLTYLAPVLLPDPVWLGPAPMLFGSGQFAVHGIVTNLELKSLHTPDLPAVALGHIPPGAWYLVQAGEIPAGSGT